MSVKLGRRQRLDGISEVPSKWRRSLRPPGTTYKAYAVYPSRFTANFSAIAIGHYANGKFKLDIALGEISVAAAAVVLGKYGISNLIAGQASGDAGAIEHAVVGLMHELRT